jgi:phosphoribosylaminoimidazole-succinocarboxamide synthase
VILRNRAAGSMARRLGLEEGTPLTSTIVEFSYKNDDLGDPLLAAEHAVAIGITTYREIGIMERYTRRINFILQDVFRSVGIELIDFKVEFGRTAGGEVILADEISPDTCRLWDTTTGERLDKDRFRNNLAPLLEGYQEVLRRLESQQKENV